MSTRDASWWIALIAWMSASTYWHVCQVKELCDAPLVGASMRSSILPSSTVDGTLLDLQASGNFGFAKSGREASLVSVRPVFESLAQCLRWHSTKRSTITWDYAFVETNSTFYPNLAVTRGKGIKRFPTGSRIREKMEFLSDSIKEELNSA